MITALTLWILTKIEMKPYGWKAIVTYICGALAIALDLSIVHLIGRL